MENPIKRIPVTDNKLKRLFAYYLYAASAFIIILLLCLIAREYSRSLDETLNSLAKLRSSLIRISNFTTDMKKTIAASGSVIPSHYFVDTPEKSLLVSLDTLKSIMPNAEIGVSGFVTKEGEVSLPVTIKGLVGDYSIFINNIGRLQAMMFPFFSIQNLAMKKTAITGFEKKNEKQLVVYEIVGELKLPKEAAQTAGASPPPGKLPVRKPVGG
ncbi:MAG: hypothetical protein A4E64_00334 [Syntrophorhabdus sp. PtaU1.Bin058]|nr:MAG: hypothetical protein A4E64_00334 [Syntrophorhabdus sp. PtaU1.Bin058]